MARSVKALVNPKLLKWAREKSSLTLPTAAEKLHITVEQLEGWEIGDAQPTFKQLLTISKTYKRPVPLFYLATPPKDFLPLQDYRRLPGTLPPLNESPQLNLEIRKAHYRRQVALELMSLLGEQPAVLQQTITLKDNPEQVGQQIRDFLTITLQTQVGWKNDYEALNGWRKALEAAGVLVFQAEKIDVAEMRGFAIGERPLPVIVVNKSDRPKGRIFSMLHEFAHILLGDSSISGDDINGYQLTPEERRVEVFCNHVAAATLLPSAWFTQDSELSGYERSGQWSDDAVIALAKRFNVSREFIWRRLLTRGKITDDFYKAKRNELIREFRARQYEEEKSYKKVIVKHHVKVLSSIGLMYPELVLNSYYQEKITSSTLSEYLGLKLKHLPKVENAVFGVPL